MVNQFTNFFLIKNCRETHKRMENNGVCINLYSSRLSCDHLRRYQNNYHAETVAAESAYDLKQKKIYLRV